MDFIQEPSIRDIRIPSNSIKERAEKDISAISNIASHVLQKAQKHIHHVKFPNLLENWLAEAINQVKSDNLLAEIKRSPLGRFLISEYKADIALDHDKAVRCKFPTGIDDIPKFIFKLTGIVQLDKIYHEIIIYNPESNKKALISDLRDFLNDYPYLKDYQASSGQTLLFASAVSNFIEATETLLEEFQCSIDLPCGEFASTPLLQAGKLGNEEVFQFLVEKKADLKKPNLEGETAENFGLCNNLFGAKLPTVIINNDDEEKSEYQWQYRTDLKNFKVWTDFKKVDSDRLQNEILKGQDERIHLSDCQIDIKEFQGIFDSTQRPFEVRFIGLPASEMFCMKDKKKEQIHTAVKWQLFHEAFGIFTCSEQKSKDINKHFLAKDVAMELPFEFPKSLNGRRTNVEGNPEDFGVVMPSPYWIVTLDFEKFIWYAKDFDLTGQIRWIPWIEKDLFKEAEAPAPRERSGKNSRKNSDADGEDDLGDSNPDDAQKFVNNILKGETPESDREKREPGRRIFEKKGKLIEELKDAFPDEKMAQDKDDLIVYGPPKLQDQVDRMLTFVATKQPPSSEPSSPRKSLSNETLIIPKKGYIANKLQGLMIKGSLINIEQNGEDLKVSGTIDQLADINEVIELFSQSKEGSEEKVIKKCFDEASFLIEDLRKAFQGQSLEISEEGDNIIVAGTVLQLDEAAKEIDRLKQVLINEKRKINEYTISGKGFLAEKLNVQMHGGKIEAKDENGDLKLSCSKINYDWLVNFLPVLEKKYEDEQKMMDIQNKIQEMGNNIDQEFKLKLFSSDLFSSVAGHLNKLIVSTKEKVEINGNPIFRWPSFNFNINNLILEIYVEGASKTQANKIEEEVRAIAHCFDVIKNVQVFYKSEKEKCRDWLSKIWVRIQLTGARRTLCQKYREALGVEIKRLLQEYQENRENEIKDLMIETLRNPNINSEDFEFAMLTKFYSEDHPLEEVKKATVQVAKEFIQKMKEDAVNEIKSNGMKIAAEARTVLDKLVQEFMRDLDKMLESGKPAEVFELFYRVELLLKGFKLNLPIFKDLPDFFDKLKNNKFVLVKASTGSGKSTLIPPLLLAMGYGRVAVTQPRRLPCRMISKRVNDTFDKTVSGWAVSGKSKNASSRLTYLTDGLLKEIIMVMGEKPLPYDVIMLDEIHERGQNVDLCIALLSLKIKRPQEKFKLILCSATVDEKIMSKFNQISKAIFDITIQNNKIIDADVEFAKLQPVYLAAELSKKLKGDQQLLCFLPSAAEVKKAVEIFNSKFKRPAYPLLANQQNSVQEQYLRDGHVFFSTTIAETSLTFKNLVAVIDSGLIRTPLFDSKDKVNVLQELEAPKSTAKQRRGRLGRTALPGTYYSATKIDDLKQEYPISELEKINLIDVYFNLLRSTKDNKKVLEILDAVPTSDAQSKNFKDKVKLAADELTQLGILNSAGTITNEGQKILDLPVRGQAKMAKAIYAALTKFGCGLDLIILSAVLLVVGQNISVLLDKLRSFVSKDGDFATVLNVMKAILQKRAQSFNKFNVLEACKEIGISSTISHLLQDCYDKYAQYEDQFNQSPYKKEAQLSNNWENIAKALLEGFYDHAFVNMKYFGGPDLYYVRLDGETSIKAILAFDSTMSEKRGTVKEYFILAKEINFVQYEDHREDAGTISFAGRLEKSWITHKVKRRYNVYEEEKVEPNFLAGNQHFKIADNKNHLMMEGQATQILEHESTLEKRLRINKEINLEAKIQALIDGTNDQLLKARYRENFDELKRDKGTIFKSVFWRWKNEHQLEINFHSQQGKIEVKNARVSQIKEIEKQIDKFVGWFKYCNLIKTDQSKIYPQTLDTTKLEYNDIRTRIERLTNPNKDRFELLEYAVGPKANRTSRMELVAWILINKFGCTLEGGFVRDWVVGGRSHFPPGTTLQMCPKEKKLAIVDETVSPKDLDIHLSSHAVFDLDNFRKQLAKYRMTVDVDKTDGWRYYMIFDKNAKTGAFTADLIEPFAYACHDMIDFDVNNLYVKSGFTSELGMRISLERVELIDSGQTESISLEKIIQNIQQKKFHVLRSARVVERIEKMKKRGWTEGPIKYSSVLPAGRPTAFTETLVEKDAGMFAYAKNLMTPLGATILKVICLSNPAFDKIYEGQRDLIKRVRNNQLNERVLFHGTSEDGAKGIAEGSFDNRYFKDGQWGYGAYFADNPIKSHGYAPANARGERVMFLCKVLLGKEQIMNQSRNGLYAPDKDYDSVRGTANRYTEYIVYRFGQAKPFAMVIYKK